MATEQSVSAVIVATRPEFRNDADRIVFAIHASFLSADYVVNAAGATAFADGALASTSSDEVGIQGWNELVDYYAFVYSKLENGTSSKVLVKGLVVNDKLIMDALKDGTSEPHHLEVSIGAYVGDSNATNYKLQYKNLDNLVDIVNKEFLSKVTGSSTSSSSAELKSSESKGLRDDRNEPDVRVTEPHPFYDPYNPYGINVPPVYPGPGHNDVNPFPGPEIFPSRGDFGSGGMLMGPNDPRFRGGGIGGEPGFPGGQPGVPPGARFDPYGPPNVPGFEPNRFARNPRRPGGGGTHPDLQRFGSGSDFI